jgi:hypothetical protein
VIKDIMLEAVYYAQDGIKQFDEALDGENRT